MIYRWTNEETHPKGWATRPKYQDNWVLKGRIMKLWLIASIFFVVLSLPMAGICRADVATIPPMIDTLFGHSVNSWFGDWIVPVGDQNGDGFDDYLVGEAGPVVYLYLGGNPPNSNYYMEFDSMLSGYMSNLGDINGDGYKDFTLIRLLSDGRMRLALFYGGPGLTTTPVFLFGDDTNWPFASNAIYGNDINHNGTPELITRDTRQRYLLIFELGAVWDSTPSQILYPPNDRSSSTNFGYSILTEDYNDDGWPDLVTDVTYQELRKINGQVLLYWGGPLFDTIPDLIFTPADTFASQYVQFGSLLEDVGDLNGDNYPDIYVDYYGSSSSDPRSFLYWGGPSLDAIPDIILSDWGQKGRLAGDVNHDGYADLITGYSTSLSGLGWSNIYYGGPSMDSIPDVHIDISDFPNYHDYFAHEVSGLGDINGDGLDDFAISTLRGAGTIPLIFLFSGWDSGTDVPYDYDATLPNEFDLKQNYPNPFNLSTTIEFDLPRAGKADLSIFNILGESVRTLFNSQATAGKYRLIWNGRDNAGDVVSSGVYIYRLSLNERASFTRKVLLIK